MRDPRRLSALWPLALLLACSPSESGDEAGARPAAPSGSARATTSEAPAESAPPSPEELIARGRSVYMGSCTACHNINPNQDGSLGPAITGASRELVEARVLRNAYPDGYTPKRTTTLMVALPYLENDIDALTAFLAE
ncbi:MAG: hypothetical protein JRG92_03705 [Deltaproteobacteria bacterium]|nr:hypothetical protein [Deltaproteobacteria bacterium]MBW2694950.1 hypothetical protein [Deltaproteobacteria bacterium]